MDWTRGQTIGHGSSAAVSIATLRSSGKIVAVKSTELSRSEPLQRENNILSASNHPNIVGYEGCDVSLENGKAVFNLMMEYAPGGTIADAVRRRGGPLDEPMVSRHARGIINGLGYLHSRGIVHGDIKGSNILWIEGEAKIADFGCARTADEVAIGGTPMFMAPEVARGEEQHFSANVWALGCTVIEMSAGNPPWPNSASTISRIAFSGEAPEVPVFLSDSAKDFLDKCLRVDPRERWTVVQLLEHPFVDEARSGCVKWIADSTRSPTSVLDRGVWRTQEFSEGACAMDCGDLLNGSMHRMKELCMNSGMENWEWGERWTTVRDSISVAVGVDFREEIFVR